VAVQDGVTYCGERLADGQMRVRNVFDSQAGLQLGYDGEGRLNQVRVSTPAGWAVEAAQRPEGRSLNFGNPGGNRLVCDLAPNGDIRSIKVNDKPFASYEYAAADTGRCVTVKYLASRKGLRPIGGIGLPQQETERAIREERFLYDSRGRLASYSVKSDRAAKEESLSFSYPEEGKVTVTDGAGSRAVITQQKDATVIEGPVGKVTLTYQAGRLRKVQDGAGDTIEYASVVGDAQGAAEQTSLAFKRGDRTASS